MDAKYVPLYLHAGNSEVRAAAHSQSVNRIWAAIVIVLSVQQLATLAFGEDAVDSLRGSAEVQGKLFAAEQELKSANAEFLKALPTLPEYKTLQAVVAECDADLDAARANNDTAGLDRAAKAKLEATKRRDVVRSELKAKWLTPAEAKVATLQRKLQELTDAEFAAKAARSLQDVKQLAQADIDWEAKQLALPDWKCPFELKGDRLGMPLDMFKRKYVRTIAGDSRTAPFCSDADPGKDNVSLFYKADEGKAGIVKASATYPFEANGAHPNRPTIAGVPTDTYIYSFVDGQLYRITIFFPQKNFAQVAASMKTKYGDPWRTETKTYQNDFGVNFEGDVLMWQKPVSHMKLTQRAGNLEQSSLNLEHDALLNTARKRLNAVGKSHADDL